MKNFDNMKDNEMKYVIVIPIGHNNIFGRRAILLPKELVHAMVKPLDNEFKVVSASFVRFSVSYNGIEEFIEPTCYGESTSLGLKSDKDIDEMIIKKQINSGIPLMISLK